MAALSLGAPHRPGLMRDTPPARRISLMHLTVPGTDARELRYSGWGYRMRRHSVPE